MDIHEGHLQWNKSFSAPDISTTSPLFQRGRRGRFSPNHKLDASFSRNVKQISCEQLCQQDFEHQVFLTTIGTKENLFSTPIKQNTTYEDNIPKYYDSPMDVDQTDSNSRTEDEISINTWTPKQKQPTILDYVDLTYEGSKPIMKKKILKAVPMKTLKKTLVPSTGRKKEIFKKVPMNTLKKTHMPSKLCLRACVSILILAIIAVPIYDKLNYNRDVLVEQISTDLDRYVFGQDEALKQLKGALNYYTSNNNGLHLLTLIGTMGVGKTLSVNIIKANFMPKQVTEVDIDNYDVSSDYLNQYHKSVPYLIILDGLVYKNMPKVIDFLKSLPRDKWLLVITVFNIQETDDMKTFSVNSELQHIIPELLAPLKFKHSVIIYDRFNTEIVKRNWNKILQVYQHKVSNINNLHTWLETHDIQRNGFKGLFEKMQLQTNYLEK